jgi:hypothetical protein
LLDELLNGVVHDVASDEPRITPLAYMIIRDATDSFSFRAFFLFAINASHPKTNAANHRHQKAEQSGAFGVRVHLPC